MPIECMLCGNGASPAPNGGIRFTTAFGAAAVPIGATGAPKFFQCRVPLILGDAEFLLISKKFSKWIEKIRVKFSARHLNI